MSKSSESRFNIGFSWKRFMKNRLALFSLIYILFISIVSFLGYLITPDNTENANEQCLEISLLPPFTTVSFLIDKKSNTHGENVFNRWLYGNKKFQNNIPIKNMRIKNDTVYFNKILNYTYGIIEKDSLHNYNKTVISQSKTYFLGTDRFGRDVLSRLIIGARVSLMVGFIAVIISLFIGIILGSLSGYYRGITDRLISWLIHVTWSIPTLLLVISISLMMGNGLMSVFVAIGLTMWVDVARIVRGQFLTFKEKEFVEAGIALGFADIRIIFKHILPNIFAPILVIATSNFASAILIESGLSFLGYGVQPPIPTWGNMIESNRNFLITSHFHLALIPGIAIMILVLAFTLLSDGIKESIE